VGLLTAGYFAIPWQWFSAPIPAPVPIFTGTLLSDSFTVVMRGILLLFALLLMCYIRIEGNDPQDDADARGDALDESPELYVLLLGALVGMCLMISANHIVIVALGMVMASAPCYLLTGMRRKRPQSSEAALKFAICGAAATGIMFYGLSLLAAVLGSAQLPTMGTRLAEMIQAGGASDRTMVLVLGALMVMVGVAFKLAAVPFHIWAPDVFEGATLRVSAFLSVAANAAGLGLLVRLAVAFSFSPDPALLSALAPVRQFIYMLLALLAAITCTFGNLAAYGQTNMKRLLAYSTIAHAGYMMMPVAAAIALIGISLDNARGAIAAMVVYVIVDMFMNLCAFACVNFLGNAARRNELVRHQAGSELETFRSFDRYQHGYFNFRERYAGLIYTSPMVTVCLALTIFSFVGLPPLAGFSAKVMVFLSLIQAKMFGLLLVGILNTVLSLVYWLGVIRAMMFQARPGPSDRLVIPWTSVRGLFCILVTVPVVALFFMLGDLWNWALAAAAGLFY
jgi:NADH-quinone oxidoreductase subunit N